MSFLKVCRTIKKVESTIENKRENCKFKVIPGSRNFFYIPMQTAETVDADGNKTVETQPYAVALDIHEWNDKNGTYHATYCTQDLKDETHSGDCPMCRATSECWDKYRHLMELAEAECERKGLKGKEAEDFMSDAKKKALSVSLAVKGAKPYLYLLAAQFEKSDTGKTVIDKETKLPKFSLKLLKWSDKRREEVATQFTNSGLTLQGSEIVLQYSDIPKGGDRSMVRLTTTPIFGKAMVTTEYPAIVDAINKAVAEFDFEEEAKKAFIELRDMTDSEAEIAMSDIMQEWRSFTAARKANNELTYLEPSPNGTEVSLSGDEETADEVVDKTVVELNELATNEPKKDTAPKKGKGVTLNI